MLKIKKNNNENSIKIGLTKNNQLDGLDESIREYSLSEVAKSINVPIDDEIEVFNLNISPLFSYIFKFDGDLETSLVTQGFDREEIFPPSEGLQRSFFFSQTFDNPNIYNQTLLSTNYLSGFDFYRNGESTVYTLINRVVSDDFRRLYIKSNQLGLINDSKLYTRFYFFNGKTGNVITFINEDNQNETSPLKLFREINIDLDNNTYVYPDTEFPNTNITLIETSNDDYSNIINDNQNKSITKAISYPDGSYFDNDGNYKNEDFI